MQSHILGKAFTICLICESVWAGSHGGNGIPLANPNPSLPGATNAEVAQIAAEVKTALGGYTAYSDCTYFTNRFHQFAQKKNFEVYSTTAFCGGDTGHAFNVIKLSDGKYYFVEPQSGTIHQPGFENRTKHAPQALCAAMGKAMNGDGTCPCDSAAPSDQPFAPNPSPVLACAGNETFRKRGKSLDNYRECAECCPGGIQTYMVKTNQPLFDQWNKQCMAACKSHFSPDDLVKAPIDLPRPSDSMAVAAGRTCVNKATDFSLSSKWEQCRGCCYDGATGGKFPTKFVGSCLAVCRAEYQ